MHKRKRGNSVFIEMINGGVACLVDEVQGQGIQRMGQPPVPVPLLSTNNNQRGQHKNNAQSHGLKVETWCICF